MKIILFLSSFLLGPLIVAQVNFSISPLIITKFHTQNNRYKFNPPNPYFNVDDRLLYHTRGGFDIGFNFQLYFPSDRHFMQGEFCIDASSTSLKFSSLGTTNTYGIEQDSFKTYSSGGISDFTMGFKLPRFSIAYGRRLTKTNSLQKIWLMSEVSLRHSYGNRASYFYDYDSLNNAVYYHNNATHLTTDYRSGIHKGYSAMIGLGLKTDFSIRFKQRKIYLGTVDFCFRQGLKTIGYLSQISIINDNGKLVGFNNTLVTKGSGFYFQFGRKFQIYPWKKLISRKNKEQKKIE